MPYRGSIGISHLAYRLPGGPIRLEDLESRGRLASPASLLREFGFDRCYAVEDEVPLESLAAACAREVLERSRLRADDFEALCTYSATMPAADQKVPDALAPFRYPSARLHHDLDLGDVPLLSFGQRGCCGLPAMIDTAARLLQGSDKRAALCVAHDCLPPGSRREIMYNVISDAAGAIILERDAARNRLVGFHQRIQTCYWDTVRFEQELMAAYFPMAQRVIEECLRRSNLTAGRVAWFVPANVSLRSWTILADMLSVPLERIWLRNVPRLGHTISCDHVINLADMEAEGALAAGDYLLLFTFGFGASWSCLVLQH